LKKNVEIELDSKFDNILDFSTSSESGIDFQYYKERIESLLANLPPQSGRVFEMKRLRGKSSIKSGLNLV
jgi:DNA-directed RNA polymerase specialized sigma24 family protein